MRKYLWIAACLAIVALSCAAYAEETAAAAPAVENAKQRFDIGAGYWYSTASLKSYVIADSDFYGYWQEGDKISELDNDLDAGLFVINAEAWVWWRIYVDGFVGFGEFDGEHKDYDWIPEISDSIWSLSKSDADGDVVTWNINGYLRVIEEPDDKGYLDLSVGYFSYEDDIEHLRNSSVLIDNWAATNYAIAGHDSQDKYSFDGFRFGARGKIRLHDRIAIKCNGGISPWMNVTDEGFWNLRDMYIDAEAEAMGFDITAALEFKVTNYFFVELGYKYFNFDSDRGDDTRTFSDGTSYEYNDAFEVEATRSGIYGMGRLKF